MRRTQIQLDEPLYELTKQRAFAEGKSMAAVVREAVAQYVVTPSKRPDSLASFSFIGSGQSAPGSPQPLSERHDDALAEDFGG